LREWVRVKRPGGSVNLAVFAQRTFQPQMGLLLQRVIQLSGGQVAHIPWEQMSQRETLLVTLQDAGLIKVAVQEERLGYHLRNAQEWWEVIQHSALRLLVEQVPTAQRDRLRSEYLAEVAALSTVVGLWLGAGVLLVRGNRPVHTVTKS